MRLHFYPTCQILGCKLIDERYISLGPTTVSAADIANAGRVAGEFGLDTVMQGTYYLGKEALNLQGDMDKVDRLLGEAGLANRQQLSPISGPGSLAGGYGVTLIRLQELAKDVDAHPDSTLTPEEQARRKEYADALSALWEKQHKATFDTAAAAAMTFVGAPLKIAKAGAAKVIPQSVQKAAGKAGNSAWNWVSSKVGGLFGKGAKEGEEAAEEVAESVLVLRKTNDIDQELMIRQDYATSLRELQNDPNLKILLSNPDTVQQAKELIQKNVHALLRNEQMVELEEIFVQEIIDANKIGTRVGNYSQRYSKLVEAHPEDLTSITVQGKRTITDPNAVLPGVVVFPEETVKSIKEQSTQVVALARVPPNGVLSEPSDIIGAIDVNLVDPNTAAGESQRRLINILYTAGLYPDSYYGQSTDRFLRSGGNVQDLPNLFADLLSENYARFAKYEEFWGPVIQSYNTELRPVLQNGGFVRPDEARSVSPKNIAWMTKKECGGGGVCTVQTSVKDDSQAYFSLAVDDALNTSIASKSDGRLIVLDGSVGSNARNKALHEICHESCHADVLNPYGAQGAVPDDPVMVNTLEELTERNIILAEDYVMGVRPDIYANGGLAGQYKQTRTTGDAILHNLSVGEVEIRPFALEQDPVGYFGFLDHRLNQMDNMAYERFIEGLSNDFIIGPAQKEMLLQKRAGSVADIRAMSTEWVEHHGIFPGAVINFETAQAIGSPYIPEQALVSQEALARYIENNSFIDVATGLPKRNGYLPAKYYSETAEGQRGLNFQRSIISGSGGKSQINLFTDRELETAIRQAEAEQVSGQTSPLSFKNSVKQHLFIKQALAAEKTGLDSELQSAEDLEMRVKKKILINKLRDFHHLKSDYVEKLLNTEIFTPEVKRGFDSYTFQTGKAGTTEGQITKDRYTVNINKLSGLDIKVPAYVDLFSGDATLGIAVKEGSGKVEKVGFAGGRDDINFSLVKKAYAEEASNSAKVKVVVFADNNGNGVIDNEEKALPWAGVSVKLTKVNEENTVSLNAGWNLVSLTLLPNQTLTASVLLKDIVSQGGNATAVSTLADGAWKSYVQRDGNNYSVEDFPIEVGKSYFVKALKPSAFKYSGQNLVSPVK